MASIGVDTGALGAAARSIEGVAARFAAGQAHTAPAVSSQRTVAAVNAVHDAAFMAESTMATRLRDTASAMASGGIAFAATERQSTSSLASLPTGHG
jgi:hypothetical protein